MGPTNIILSKRPDTKVLIWRDSIYIKVTDSQMCRLYLDKAEKNKMKIGKYVVRPQDRGYI